MASALDILFSIVSLETMMYYYNKITHIYEEIAKKSNKSLYALASIWVSSQPTHHYSNYLENTWSYDPENVLLWNTKYPKENTKKKAMPWLTAEVYYGDVKLADCSNWISKLHYLHYNQLDNNGLTTDIILQAWATEHLHTIYYSDLGAYRFVVIDEMGDDKTLNIGTIIA